MAEVLSQQEIDQLLTAISSGAINQEKEKPVKKIKVYDFKRPDVLTIDEIRTISLIHQDMADNLEEAFSRKLGKKIAIKVAIVDTLTYEEFIRSTPSNSVINAFNFSNMKPVAVEVCPSTIKYIYI